MRLKTAASSSAPAGFQFAQPDFRTFSTLEPFRKELHAQAASTELVDATALARIDSEGRLVGIGDELRLTRAAFGQVCHLCKLPRSWIETLARRNEALALEVVAESLETMLCRDTSKVLVTDTRTGIVHAVVDRDSYNLVTNEAVLDLALSSMKNAKLNRAFVDGASVRITIVDPLNIAEPKVGDVVRMGTDITTDIGADAIVTARTYNERLRCLNGMTVTDRALVQRLSARQDVAADLPDMLLSTVTNGKQLGPMMRESAKLYLDEHGIDRMTGYLANPQFGGNNTLLMDAVKGAQAEAVQDSRDEGELTLWDFVNGVTAAAKNARTLNRRIELEGMGYRVMTHFVGRTNS